MTDDYRTCKVELGYNRLSGRKTINQYETIEEIARGAYSKVKLAQDTETGEKVAIKIIRRSSRKHHAVRTALAILKEVNILKAVSHDNIITLHVQMGRMYSVALSWRNPFKAGFNYQIIGVVR